MKGGKKRNSSVPSEAAGARARAGRPSRHIREPDLVGEAAEHQERDEAPEDAVDVEEEPLSPVAGEEEEEEKNDESEEIPVEDGNSDGDGDGDGDGDAENVKPKLAEGFYEIEAVRRKRTRKSQVQYLIKWRGWPETANTWEPVDNLWSCSDVIDAFEESLKSGKQRSTRKRKRKAGATHTQPKKKQQQQQCSPAAATYNVPAVKVRIVEEPTPSPPLNGLKATKRVDNNGTELNGKVDKVVNGNGLRLGLSLEKTGEQNELNLKLSELKGVTSTNESPVDISGNGLSNGFPKANGAEPYQSDRCTGARKRKSGSVRRFKQDPTSAVMNDIQDALAAGPLATFVQEGIHNHEIVRGDLVCRNKPEPDDSKDVYTITQLVKPMSYSASASDIQDVSVTFLAKRSDGKEMMVDNKFLKMNNPLLLINFYEQHLRYNPLL